MADVDNRVTIAQGAHSAVSSLIDTMIDTMNTTSDRMRIERKGPSLGTSG